MSGITPKQNVFKFKFAPHQQESIAKTIFWKDDGPPGQRGPVLKHNGKFGTEHKQAKHIQQ